MVGTMESKKLIAKKLGWNDAVIRALGFEGVRFVLGMIRKHDEAESRLEQTNRSSEKGEENGSQRSS